jgi:hypothetical protein
LAGIMTTRTIFVTVGRLEGHKNMK